jgi:hypothetical protein
MSAVSDKYENDVAEYINKMVGLTAKRPSKGTDYSDVQITKYNNKTLSENVWIEVKMSHTDNLSNPRVFYKGGEWQTTYKTPAAAAAVELLNNSTKAATFITNIAKFSGIPKKSIKIPTTKSGLLEEGAVPLHVMKSYFSQPGVNRYILDESNYDLGDVVTKHYTIGKTEPAYYMQAGDDFYMISGTNPLGLNRQIPKLSGKGNFKMRIGTRSEFYEVQAEIKITKFDKDSLYSVKPGTKKLNPFK